MIYLVIYSVMLMLAGILLWETIKYLWNELMQYRIRSECDRYEADAWINVLQMRMEKAKKQKEIKEIFERLKKEYDKAEKQKEAEAD